MELRQLRYFVAVAEELHFGAAAQKACVAQPALSRQVRDLENEIGADLIDRRGRSIRLTGAGSVFAEQAQCILRDVENAIVATRFAAKEKADLLRVGIAGDLADRHLGPIIRAWCMANPNADVDLQSLDIAALQPALRDSKIDVWVGRTPPSMGCLVTETIWQEAMMVALPTCHPFVSNKLIDLRAIDNKRILLPTHDSDLLALSRRILQDAGISPRTIYETSSISIALALVTAGRGIAMVPELCDPIVPDGVSLVPLQSQKATFEIGLIHRADESSPAVLSFIEIAKEVVRLRLPRSARPPRPRAIAKAV